MSTTTTIICPFVSSNCGSTKGVATPQAGTPGLTINSELSINGSTDLSSCIVGHDRGKVYGIRLVTLLGPTFQIQVDGEGPSGVTSGSLYLWFTDSSNSPGGVYKLWIYSHTRKVHTVDFTSAAPTLINIEWSDQDH